MCYAVPVHLHSKQKIWFKRPYTEYSRCMECYRNINMSTAVVYEVAHPSAYSLPSQPMHRDIIIITLGTYASHFGVCMCELKCCLGNSTVLWLLGYSYTIVITPQQGVKWLVIYTCSFIIILSLFSWNTYVATYTHFWSSINFYDRRILLSLSSIRKYIKNHTNQKLPAYIEGSALWINSCYV